MSHQLSLLVIDDDALDRKKVRRAFHTAALPVDIEIVEAETWAQATEHIAQQKIDCILLDYQLPDADGLHIVHELRQQGVVVPIVMLTGQGDERIAVELMKAGSTDYLSKEDLQANLLVQSVRNAIRLREAEAQTAAAIRDSLSHLRFVAEAGRVLATSLDVPTIVEHLAQLVVPQLATWCAIDLATHDGQLVRKLDYPAEPSVLPVQLDTPGLMVPISSRGQMHGTLHIARAVSEQPFAPTDLALAQELAQRAAISFDNAQLYEQAREAVRIRDEFLSIASHELRTPLTSLLGYVQLLERRALREGFLQDRDQRALRVVVEQATRLNKMISSLLDVSRLQSGQFSLHNMPLDLCVLVRHIVEEMRPTLDRHTLELELAASSIMLLGDEVRLHQVVLNLLQNAVKYSPEQGTIHIKLRKTGPWAELAVSDQGIGIPAEAIPNLFHRFYRAKNADEQQVSGIGLGLYVVHEIVALHSGYVTVESQIGHGSTFTVRLPLMES
jgi:signal transduction histidine kinase